MGRRPAEIDIEILVDRSTQIDAIALHASQSEENPVRSRRLAMTGSAEHLRLLRTGPDG